MKDNIYLVGGGGHCKSVIDVIRATGKFNIRGIVDLPENQGEIICGVEVVASDEALKDLVSETSLFLVTVGFVDSPALRVKLFNRLQDYKARMPAIVSSRAHISEFAEIGAGTIVMHGALVNSSAVVGSNCIVNSNALVEHDAIIGNHCHISTGAIVNGGCELEDEVFLGSNAVLVHGVKVARGTIIGAGTVVHKSIVEPSVYVGNPFRKIR